MSIAVTPAWMERLWTPRVLVRVWLVLLALSPVWWLALKPYASSREVSFTITPVATAGPWMLEWLGRTPGTNGVWLDIADGPSGTVITRRLPAYWITVLQLEADQQRPTIADVSAVRMRVAVWGVPTPAAELHPRASGVSKMTVRRSPSLHAGHHVLGVVGVACILLGVGGLGLLLAQCASPWRTVLKLVYAITDAISRIAGPLVRWRGAFLLILAVTAAVHAWMAWWGPMLYLPDGVEYIHNALRLYQTGDFAHFNAWRMPGTSFFLLPFIAVFSCPEAALGWFQAIGGVAIAAMAFDMLRRLVPRGWALLGMLLVGIDPLGLVWERHIITEAPTALLFTAAAWVMVRASGWELRTRRGLAIAMGGALALGLIAALATYVRGNAMLLVLVGPVVVGLSLWRRRPRARAALVAGVVAVAALGALSPWVARTNRVFGVPAMIVGSGFARVIFAWYAGEIDVNQTAAFGFEAWKNADRRQKAGANEFDFLPQLDASPRLPDVAGVHPWVRRDQRYQLVADESRARRPLTGAALAAECLLSHLFIYRDPAYQSFRSTDFYTQPHRGKLIPGTTTNWFRSPEDTLGLDRSLLNDIAVRTRRDIAWVQTSPNARVFRRFYFGFRAFRPALGVLFLVGGFIAVRRWDVAAMPVAAIWMGNAAAFSWIILNGETRYSEPLYALLIVVAVYGAAAIFTRPPGALSREAPPR